MAYNYGAFFGNSQSSSSNNIFDSIDISGYSSIKNGSYGKLVKSYYAKDKTSSSSSDKTEDSKNTKTDTDTTGLSKMKKESDALSDSVDALNSSDLFTLKDGKYDMEKIAEKVKSFVSEYNDTISQSSKVNSTDVSKQISNMQSMTSVMTKALSNVGITAGVDGKLSLDEDKLKDSAIKDIKSLFYGSNSYASQVQKYADDTSKAAVNSSSIYSASGTLESSLSGLFNDYV